MTKTDFAFMGLLLVGCFAVACDVDAEGDALEIEATVDEQACSSLPPGPGDSDLIAIIKGGRRVSYTSLTPSQRATLDLTFGEYEDTANGDDGSCTFLSYGLGGWQCEGEHWMCYCIHYSTTTDCHCEKDDC